MKKNVFSNTKRVVVIALISATCCIWALVPLWVNPCVPTRLSEEEIEQIRTHPSWEDLSLEQQVEQEQRYREEEIPCGSQGLPTREKLNASRFQGMILDEISFLFKPLILRFEMVDAAENGGAYYFKAYTFFYIPLYRVFAGGSGYMEIDRWPFETHEGDIGEWK